MSFHEEIIPESVPASGDVGDDQQGVFFLSIKQEACDARAVTVEKSIRIGQSGCDPREA